MQSQFIVEKFTNKDKTKVQVYELPGDNPEELEKMRAFYRRQIDPDLTWLFEISYLDYQRKTIYTEMYDIDGNLIRKEEPWYFGRNRYSAGKKGGNEDDSKN